MKFVFSGSMLRFVDYRRQIDYPAGDVESALHALFADFPDLPALLLGEDGQLRRSLRLAVNQELIPSDLAHKLGANDTVELMTAVSGG